MHTHTHTHPHPHAHTHTHTHIHTLLILLPLPHILDMKEGSDYDATSASTGKLTYSSLWPSPLEVVSQKQELPVISRITLEQEDSC